MLRWTTLDSILLAVVVVLALAMRIVWLRADTGELSPIQWPDERVTAFAKSLVDEGTFRGPVALKPPATTAPSASLAPGYPVVVAAFYRVVDFATAAGQPEQQRDASVRSVAHATQCILGALTAGLLFLLARRLFESRTVAACAGVLASSHYFWVAATGELADGVLTSLLLVFSLWGGLRLAEKADAATTIACSLALGCLALTRAGLLLFAIAELIWIVSKLRAQHGGWRYATLAVVVLTVTLLPWTWRNARLFGRFVPISTEAGLHLWWGNNDEATGGLVPRPIPGEPLVLDTTEGLAELIHPATDRGKRLAQRSEPERFASMRREAYGWIAENPGRFAELRLHAAVFFLTGQRMWLEVPEPADAFDPFAVPGVEVEAPPLDALEVPAGAPGDEAVSPPPTPLEPGEVTLAEEQAGIEESSLPVRDDCAPWVLGVLLLGGLVGMRWSWRWRRRLGLLTLALVFVPLPVIATHAGLLHAARLPLDGILLVYTAFALTCLVPRIGGKLRRGLENAMPVRETTTTAAQ